MTYEQFQKIIYLGSYFLVLIVLMQALINNARILNC